LSGRDVGHSGIVSPLLDQLSRTFACLTKPHEAKRFRDDLPETAITTAESAIRVARCRQHNGD
jgi:uncharacterized protein YerC